jgi:RHS repeat-associated protein
MHAPCSRTLIQEPGLPRRIQMYNTAGLLLAEVGVNSSNTVTELKSYFYNGRNGIAERLRLSSGYDVTNYVHSDHLGSPIARINSVASVYERTLYEVYGLKVMSQPNPPYGIGLFPDGLGYAGHRTDRVSGLSYMQQRYYDPVAGRFISMDPVTADSGVLFNRYVYANNNPIGMVDPDGRAASWILRAVAPQVPSPIAIMGSILDSQNRLNQSPVRVTFIDPKTGERTSVPARFNSRGEVSAGRLDQNAVNQDEVKKPTPEAAADAQA